jgi:transcriptional regulator with XRE-family HTH domain
MEQGVDQGVGARIKRLREERDWSMAKLAVEADMSVSGVSMIENGKRNLTTTTLAKLARAFGVEIRDLFPLGQTPLPDFEDEVLFEAAYSPENSDEIYTLAREATLKAKLRGVPEGMQVAILDSGDKMKVRFVPASPSSTRVRLKSRPTTKARIGRKAG